MKGTAFIVVLRIRCRCGAFNPCAVGGLWYVLEQGASYSASPAKLTFNGLYRIKFIDFGGRHLADHVAVQANQPFFDNPFTFIL